MEPSESEAELWDRARDGDPFAFGALFDAHYQRLFISALRSARSAVDAEDLVAITFLEFWRKRDSVRVVNGSVLPWLLATELNVGRNARRAQTRYRLFLARLPRPTDAGDPLEDLQRFEGDRRAAELLQTLPKKDAQILALTALDGLTTVAAAAALGISPQTARARLARARQRARLALSPNLEGGLS